MNPSLLRTATTTLLLASALLLAGSAQAAIVINEIHYHPSNMGVMLGEDAEDLQFIELHNSGADPVDLSGAYFADGVTCTLPAGTVLEAGGYLVVAQNPDYLALRGTPIPDGVTVVPWIGDLSNGGETIQVVDAAANLLDEVTYDDAGLWPTAPDGGPGSLELANPGYDSSYPQTWRASLPEHGTPGAQNSRFTEGPIVLFEVPERGSVVGAPAEIAVTFAEPVSGVAAGDLVVDGSAATDVVCDTCAGGVGAGPWVFTGYAAPSGNPYTVIMGAGAIQDLDGNAFSGAAWRLYQSVPDIVINEVHYNPDTATDAEEFIEIYNADTAAVDISGWSIVEFASPGCLFPPGTVMQPGDYVVCAKDPVALEAATGYLAPFSWGVDDSLSNGGEPIALLDALGTPVDRIEYDDAPAWPSGVGGPDGGGPTMELINPALDNAVGSAWRASALLHGTPGARNSVYSDVPAVAAVDPTRGAVIDELLQIEVTFSKPVTGVTAADLTVGDALGGNAVAASAVTGTGAGPYVFTVADPGFVTIGVTLASGAIQDLDGTPFPGDAWLYFSSLPAIVVNELHYNPDAAAVAATEDAELLQFLELYNAEAETVDLSGYAVSNGINFVFPAGTTIPADGYLVVAKDAAFLQSKVTIPAGAQVFTWTSGDLSNGGETVELTDPYGHVIDRVPYDDGGDWPSTPDGDGPSAELINPALANDSGAAWLASLVVNGTPGGPNGVYRENPAPIVFGARHSPSIPQGGQAVTITATALDDAGAPQSVTLFYRQDQDPPIAYQSMPMVDDGTHGDGVAGDGRYGAIVPGLPAGQQLDFYIEATDDVGTTVAPAGHSTPNRFGQPSQTYLCKFSNEVLPTNYPTYHILVTLNNKRHQEALTGFPAGKEEFDATFIDGEGNIWYNVTERYRGQSSLYKYPRSYLVEFPKDRPLDSVMGFPVETLQLNGQFPVSQWLMYDLFRRAGHPGPIADFAHLRYTGINYDDCCDGQNGYYGLHVAVTRYGNDFLDGFDGAVPTHGLSSEGNLYRGRNDADLRWEGTNPDTYRVDANGQRGYVKYNNEVEDDWRDLIALTDALNNSDAANYPAHVLAHVDPDNWARYFALHMLLGNREGGLYLDTGDDYFIWFPPVDDPLNPEHPDYATSQLPGDRVSGGSKLMPWDADSTVRGANYTIWRTTVAAPQRFLRHNAFAPIFVKDIEDLAATVFSLETMSAIIDAMPDDVFATSGGSVTNPVTRQQYKDWIASRIDFVLNETVDELTLDQGPWITYTGADGVIPLSGQLQQAGTHAITVNGQPADFSVFHATWSYALPLEVGGNPVLVQAWDREGNEKDRIEARVFYNPEGPWQLHMEMRAPNYMVNDKTITIEAKIADPIGRVSWERWDELGTVSVVRLPDRTPVEITPTVFDDHLPVPDDSIRFMNGWGSVSFTLDEGAAFAGGDIEVTVTWEGLSASRRVTVLADPAYRVMAGNLTGANLVWGPDEVIRMTGHVDVPAGSTLTIHPGTIVQVDSSMVLEAGYMIHVYGALEALGTKDRPIAFFSEGGPQAMTLTQSGSASNLYAYRGIQFFGGGSSTLRHVIVSGAGNGSVVSHPRPPVLAMYDSHSLWVDRCVFADNGGMIFSGQGSGTYTVRKTLVHRAGIGAEFFGAGHTLLLRDSWFLAIGRAPEANNLDGDLLHIDHATATQLIRSCILNDGGDDGVDHSGSSFRLEHTIIHGVRDKSISMTGGFADVHNVLMFDNGIGIRGRASTSYTTIAVPAPIAANEVITTTVVWPNSIDTCSGTVSYTDVGNPAHLGCGTANFSADPQYADPAGRDYNPAPGSPALTAGPNEDRIGWLGFPYGSVCATTADCDDTNACTEDVCVDKLCTFTPIVGCVPCDIDEDCDDSDPCTLDTCAADGACNYAPAPDGTVCDDGKSCTSPDTCAAGICEGPENCPGGGACDEDGDCSVGDGSIVFQDGVNGYAGTHDTHIREAAPDATHGAETSVLWDATNPDLNRTFALIRFGDLVGPGDNQIPPGATVDAATLTLWSEDPSVAPAGGVLVSLAPWDEGTATWNTFGGEPGVQDDEIGMWLGDGPLATGAWSLDVTSVVAGWVADPATNHGWIIRPNSDDGARVTSSEGAVVEHRPLLTISYTLGAPGCTSDGDCDDGLYCNGAEQCDTVSGDCLPGEPPVCDDAIDCTTDTCDEGADACLHAPSNVLCDDGNLCTDDVCDPADGCIRTNNAAPCDDGDVCTVDDACEAGACEPGAPRDCDDGLACTADACDPVAGCSNTDTCPAGEVCSADTGVCETGPTIVDFQEGVDGYSGSFDTYVHAALPDVSNAASTSLVVDGVPPDVDERQILLRFEDIFGEGEGLVPPGAPIVSATLTVFVRISSEDGADLHRMLVPWTDDATWNSLTDGVQTDDVEALAAIDASGATNSSGVPFEIDVTASLAAWSGGEPNHGWVLVTPEFGTESWHLASSEEADETRRPLLTVVFVPCDPGYEGDGVACSDVDECLADPGPCGENGTCNNVEGSYECACDEGFEEADGTCVDVDECVVDAIECGANASCVNTPGAWECTCDDGYADADGACVDVDECAAGDTDLCGHGEACQNTIGSYECVCADGYRDDGAACVDVDECAEGTAGCHANATCTNDDGSFTCDCDDGYDGDGFDCANIDECAVGDPCDPNATCVDEEGSFTCTCAAGFVGDGLACGECPGGAADPCNGNGVCDGTAGAPFCVCADNYGGLACERCTVGSFGYPDCQPCGSCGDGDPCTIDSCDPVTGCENDPIPGCCTQDTQCVPPGECLAGVCETGPRLCGAPEPIEGCCDDDAQCDDGNDETDDRCDLDTGTCENLWPCAGHAECDDGDPCTVNECQDGGCVLVERIANCCTADAQCDDGNPTTTDTCDAASNTCVHVGCVEDAECEDGDPCVINLCSNGACVDSEPLPGCCRRDADCDDGDPGTVDTCDPIAHTCRHVGPCDADADCDDGDPCTVNQCRDHVCVTSDPLPECCRVHEECQVPLERCTAANRCEPVLCSACETDADCGSDGNLCLDYVSGNRCGIACTAGGAPCPEGSTCRAIVAGTTQCVPDQGDCECVSRASVTCSDGALFWLTSCGEEEGVADDCDGRGCVADACCAVGTHVEGGVCVEDAVTPDVVDPPDAGADVVGPDDDAGAPGDDTGAPGDDTGGGGDDDAGGPPDTGTLTDSDDPGRTDAKTPTGDTGEADAGKTGSGSGDGGCSATGAPAPWAPLLALLLALALPLALRRRRRA